MVPLTTPLSFCWTVPLKYKIDTCTVYIGTVYSFVERWRLAVIKITFRKRVLRRKGSFNVEYIAQVFKILFRGIESCLPYDYFLMILLGYVNFFIVF